MDGVILFCRFFASLFLRIFINDIIVILQQEFNLEEILQQIGQQITLPLQKAKLDLKQIQISLKLEMVQVFGLPCHIFLKHKTYLLMQLPAL